MGIPAPLLHALASPTRHRGRSTLPGTRLLRGLPPKGCCARQVRAGGRGAALCEPLPPRATTKAKAVRVRRVLGPLPSPASPPGAPGPAGYPFRGWPGRAQEPLGKGNILRPRDLLAAISCLRFPDGWQEDRVGSRHPPCRGLRAKRENFLLNRGTRGPRESPQCPRGWQSPAAPLALPWRSPGSASMAEAAQPMARRWL